MRCVLQRVTRASVAIGDKVSGAIGYGFVILFGAQEGDTEQDMRYCAEKVIGLRVFEDAEGKMNRSILDVNGQALAISQFTLLGDARHGRRPSFSEAARPEKALPLYEGFCGLLRAAGIDVRTGEFGADMAVSLVNDGPVTILLDSRKAF